MEHYSQQLAKQNEIIQQQLAGLQQQITQQGPKQGILAGTAPEITPLSLLKPMQFTPDSSAYVTDAYTGNKSSLLPFSIPVATTKHSQITSPEKEQIKKQRIDAAAQDPGDPHK